MKSRTSLFNPAVFKKDVTRFAPAWVLYAVGLLMVLSVCLTESQEYYRATNLADTLSFMAAINLCYGLLNGQLLFGDLFNARHCNALHAMPLRRECWFVTHVAAGLLFSLVPNLVMSLIALVALAGGWSVALWWLLAVTLQYLFFFGLAVCSALCVGNRFAMVLVYGIVNFFALIVYWFYYSIYQPLLYGVYGLEGLFLLWCPPWTMMENYNMIQASRLEVETAQEILCYVKSVTLGEGWGYLAICAAIGAALIGIALALYRRRKLESAGDFMAVKALGPVFLVLYTLCAAACFQAFARLFGAFEYVFLALGLAVGFFTGRMLLMRTTRVFQPKAFLRFAVLAVALVISMVLTWLDPLGITARIPDTDEIEEVYLTQYRYYGNSDWPALDSEEDIEAIRALHQMVLDGQIESDQEVAYGLGLNLHYVLDNGSTLMRQYEVTADSPAGQVMRGFMTRPEYVLGTTDPEEIVRGISYAYYALSEGGQNGQLELDDAYLRGLLEAIMADCAEGTMAQNWAFHEVDEYCWIEFQWHDAWGEQYKNISVYEDARNTIAYLTENEIPFQAEDTY